MGITLFPVLQILFFCDLSAENINVSNRALNNAIVDSGKRLSVLNRGITRKSDIRNGGVEEVCSGGQSFNASVAGKGKLLVRGGKAYNSAVSGGGVLAVGSRDNKKSYSVNASVFSGGRMNVYNHSLAEKVTVYNGGLLRVYLSGSLVSDVTVASGGVLHVWKNGTAQNVYVAPGGLLDLREKNPVLKGDIKVAGQLKASFNNKPDVSQANIIIDLPRRRVEDDHCIINLDYLNNEIITVQVDRNQQEGSYKLASGALKWKKSLNLTAGTQAICRLYIGKPVKYSDRYYTLKRVDKSFIELEISRTQPDETVLSVEIDVSPRQRQILKDFGFDIVAENYSVSASGKKLTQQDLDADVQVIIDQFRFLGKKCVAMSRNPKIIIRGIGGTYQGGGALCFQHRSTGAIRHEFNHSFEPFGLAYRFWKGLNRKNFYYVSGHWKHGEYGLTYREKLNCASNQKEFIDDFMGSYGQTTIHEDITMIFGCATSPKSAHKCLERSRRNPVFRKKLYYLIASYSEVTTDEFWSQLMDFTEEEKKQIKACRIDIEKERDLKIYYTKHQPYRYSFQKLSTTGLLDISPEMMNASGIRKIKFFKDPGRKPVINNDTLTYYERSPSGADLAKGIFMACYRRHPILVKRHLHNRLSEEEWAKLFASCTFKGIRRIARQSSKSDKMYKNVLCLKKFTAEWLSGDFWAEFDWLYDEYKKDLEYSKSFEQYGIVFNVPLPDTVQGEKCSGSEAGQGKHTFMVCSSVFTGEFMRKCKIKQVAIAKNMKINGKKVRGGTCVDGILCIDPTDKKLAKSIFQLLYMNSGIAADERQWQRIANSSAEDRGRIFGSLLWNSYDMYLKAQKNEKLYNKIKFILAQNILGEHVYETMNFKRFTVNYAAVGRFL